MERAWRAVVKAIRNSDLPDHAVFDKLMFAIKAVALLKNQGHTQPSYGGRELKKLAEFAAQHARPMIRRRMEYYSEGWSMTFLVQVIIFIGNFVRSSDMGHEGSIIEKQCRLFGELGACLCSPDFDLGCRSLASLVEFVQRAGARTDYWTAPTLATGRVLGLYPRARRLW